MKPLTLTDPEPIYQEIDDQEKDFLVFKLTEKPRLIGVISADNLLQNIQVAIIVLNLQYNIK
jgi:hypothetical protein